MSRPSLGRPALFAAAAAAGAIVYWRANERQRSRQRAAIDEAVHEGRAAAHTALTGSEPDVRPFEQS